MNVQRGDAPGSFDVNDAEDRCQRTRPVGHRGEEAFGTHQRLAFLRTERARSSQIAKSIAKQGRSQSIFAEILHHLSHDTPR